MVKFKIISKEKNIRHTYSDYAKIYIFTIDITNHNLNFYSKIKYVNVYDCP